MEIWWQHIFALFKFFKLRGEDAPPNLNLEWRCTLANKGPRIDAPSFRPPDILQRPEGFSKATIIVIVIDDTRVDMFRQDEVGRALLDNISRLVAAKFAFKEQAEYWSQALSSTKHGERTKCNISEEREGEARGV